MNKDLGQMAFIGVGGCGMNLLETWLVHRLPSVCSVGVNRDRERMSRATLNTHQVLLDSVTCIEQQDELPGASREEIQSAMLAKMPELTEQLKASSHVFILAGLGGSTGTWASQFMCNQLLSIGKQVVTVLVMPFAFERNRLIVAEESLAGFDVSAHRILCFNDDLIWHAHENTSVEDAFAVMNEKVFDLLHLP